MSKDINQGGRPTVMTDAVLSKLETAFALGFTDEQACVLADIAPSTLYDYQKANPQFSERKKLLKGKIEMQAQYNLAKSIGDGDEANSKWWLERKKKAEFSPRIEQDLNPDGQPMKFVLSMGKTLERNDDGENS